MRNQIITALLLAGVTTQGHAQLNGLSLDSALDVRPLQTERPYTELKGLPFENIKGPSITVQPLSADDTRALELEQQRQAENRRLREQTLREENRPAPVQNGRYEATTELSHAQPSELNTALPTTAPAPAASVPSDPLPAKTPPTAQPSKPYYDPPSITIAKGLDPDRACHFFSGLNDLVPKQGYIVKGPKTGQCETDWVPVSEGTLRYLARGDKEKVYHLQLDAHLSGKQHIIGNAAFRAAVKTLAEKALPYSLTDEVYDAIQAEKEAKWEGVGFEIIFERLSSTSNQTALTFTIRKTKL